MSINYFTSTAAFITRYEQLLETLLLYIMLYESTLADEKCIRNLTTDVRRQKSIDSRSTAPKAVIGGLSKAFFGIELRKHDWLASPGSKRHKAFICMGIFRWAALFCSVHVLERRYP